MSKQRRLLQDRASPKRDLAGTASLTQRRMGWMGKGWLVVLILLVLMVTAAPAPAPADEQIKEGKETSIVDFLRNAKIGLPGEETSPREKHDQSPIPAVWCGDIGDDETRAICWRAYRAGLSYYETGLVHRIDVFNWQHLSTKIILVVVIFLVSTGVYFAWIQFRHDLTITDEKVIGSEGHTIELSVSGLKVRSSVLGVIILSLSMGFFYLYLRYVFPIREIF